MLTSPGLPTRSRTTLVGCGLPSLPLDGKRHGLAQARPAPPRECSATTRSVFSTGLIGFATFAPRWSCIPHGLEIGSLSGGIEPPQGVVPRLPHPGRTWARKAPRTSSSPLLALAKLLLQLSCSSDLRRGAEEVRLEIEHVLLAPTRRPQKPIVMAQRSALVSDRTGVATSTRPATAGTGMPTPVC